jgi:hypothetical protein
MIEELKQYLTINKHQLDDELIEQASVFYKVSELSTEAAAKRDAEKEYLATIAAEIEQNVRTRLGDKATEGKVKSLVILEKEHRDATSNYLTTKAEADKLQALKEAFHQRGYMLRDLVQLYISNYFSVNSVRPTEPAVETVYKIKRAMRNHPDRID